MGRWIRVDALLHDHPRIVSAGPWGLVVIQATWRMCKAHDRLGVLPDTFWTPQMIAKYTLFPDSYLPQIEEGMQACERAGLVTRNDRNVELHDWDQYQKDSTAADRMVKYRQKKALTREKHDSVTSNSRNVTLQDTTGQDITGGSSPDLRTSRGTDDTIAHPPAIEKEAPRASRPWIVQSEWTAAYDAAYGHPPYWDARRHEEGARALISYLEGLCSKRRMELTDQTLREGTQRAAGKYLADKSAWLTKAQHPFEQLVKNIHVYLHENRKG